MVDSIRPTYQPLKNLDSARVNKSSDVETPTDDKAGQAYVVTKDRRQKKDRRDRGHKSRAMYDMRSKAGGRRKDDKGGPNIEVRV
ncbi:MAG: hypothetical protein K6L81_02910 [Agarilytica sp.]